ncbi:hypothetical protein MMPV_004700 [Pyropia vietnamensis]
MVKLATGRLAAPAALSSPSTFPRRRALTSSRFFERVPHPPLAPTPLSVLATAPVSTAAPTTLTAQSASVPVGGTAVAAGGGGRRRHTGHAAAPVPLLAALLRPLSDGLHIPDHMLAGAAATASAVTVMHPLDTVKVHMQRASAGAGAPQSIVSSFRSIVSGSGVGGLYRGVGASVAGQGPAGAVKFAVYEGLTQAVGPRVPTDAKVLADFACAAAAFVACSVVLLPAEVLKQRLQAGVYASAREGIREVWAREGIRGFYRGWTATCVRDVPYSMLEFGLYGQFKRVARGLLARREGHPTHGPAAVATPVRLSAKQEWLIGGLAGGCTGFLTTPLDVAKTRLMTQVHLPVEQQSRGILQALSRVVASDGLPGIFCGGSARVAWLIPFTAVFFGVHEASKRALLRRKRVGPTLAGRD